MRAIRPTLWRAAVPMVHAQYTIELYRPGGLSAGVEDVMPCGGDPKGALAFYRLAVAFNRSRLIVLCERGRILARSDRPDTGIGIAAAPTSI